MSESTAGSGPALAAHSKDASTPGQSTASSATGEARLSTEGGEAVSRALQQAADFVRGQPIVSIAALIMAGEILGKFLRRG